MTHSWDPENQGILVLPSGRLVRGRALRKPIPDGPSPDFGLYLLGHQPDPTPWPYRWLHSGFIEGEQLTPGGPWHLRITEELRRRIVPEVPEGWLALDQAAKALGVARQTVLHKVQRGELEAVHVNSGKRKGLRINVRSQCPGLFATPQ